MTHFSQPLVYWRQPMLHCMCGYTIAKSVAMIGVSGEGLLRVCTELPSGHGFKTAAQDQSQSENTAP